MAINSKSGYSDTEGTRLIRALLAEGQFVFSTDEADAVGSTLGIKREVLNQVLAMLNKSGWISRLRRGLYAISGSLPGGVDVHPFLIATRLVEPSAISHWSAMNYHGLLEQVPQVVTAFTAKKVYPPDYRTGKKVRSGRKPSFEVMGLHYEYVTVKPSFYFGFGEEWIDTNSMVPITDKERTMLEGFISPRYFGGLGVILDILEEHYDELNSERLLEYALRVGRASAIKRLGWALASVGAPESILFPLKDHPIKGFRLLDPTLPRRGPYDRDWMIQNNIHPGDER